MTAGVSAVQASDPRVFWSLDDCVRAVSELPVTGPLPVRTVLVPSERVAHALRRHCLRVGLAHILAGTRFLTPIAAAAAVLRGAGVQFDAGEEGKRAARL